MNIKIDRQTPYRKSLRRRGKYREVVNQMAFGDSVVVETRKEAMCICVEIGKQSGATASYRTEDDGKFRVWKLSAAYKK